jgi:rod shape-determining protein MreD
MSLAASCVTIDFVSIENVHVIFFLAPLFFWTVYRPDFMPLWFVFLAGFAIDLSVDAPIGLHSFGFLVLAIILLRFRRIIVSQPFIYHILIYAVSSSIFEILRWALLSLLSMQIITLFPSLLTVVINIIVFLPLVLVLRGVHRIVSPHGRVHL